MNVLVQGNMFHKKFLKAMIGGRIQRYQRKCLQCFLTQAQVNSAKGNKHTKLPRYLKLPDHWLTES